MLGVDPIVGLNTNCILSPELLSYLNDYGVNTLNQARNTGEGIVSYYYWFPTTDLELEGTWKEEWSHFICGLSHGGIRLLDQKDKLLWMYNTENGEVSTKLAYDVIVTSKLEKLKGWKYHNLWLSHIPINLK